jgi:hypothetical protein
MKSLYRLPQYLHWALLGILVPVEREELVDFELTDGMDEIEYEMEMEKVIKQSKHKQGLREGYEKAKKRQLALYAAEDLLQNALDRVSNKSGYPNVMFSNGDGDEVIFERGKNEGGHYYVRHSIKVTSPDTIKFGFEAGRNTMDLTLHTRDQDRWQNSVCNVIANPRNMNGWHPLTDVSESADLAWGSVHDAFYHVVVSSLSEATNRWAGELIDMSHRLNAPWANPS